jgi:hypothetical protein
MIDPGRRRGHRPIWAGPRALAAAAALGMLAALAAPGPADANGRPPATSGIAFRPGDPDALYVATTFGLLVSHDGGCTVRWICEADLGYGGRWDPAYAITRDGTIFATTYTGLRVSHDGGCSFATATAALPPGDPGRIANRWIDALALGPDGAVWVATSDTGAPNDVFASTDGGATFASRGLPSPTIFWKSLAIAPSDARRVYVTGYELTGASPDAGAPPPAPHVRRTDDAGAHWTDAPLAGVTYGPTPVVLVLAVDPRDAGVVYLASRGANPPSGDRLYRSADGGASFAEVLATADPVHDVVVLDAQAVIVATQTEAGQGGAAYASADAGRRFTRMSNAPRLACLGQAPDGSLYGCAANWDPDYMAITRSTDGGATFRKIGRFAELAGPLACPDGTAERDVCDRAQWPSVQAQLAATGPTCGARGSDAAPAEPPPPPARGCCDAGDAQGALVSACAAVLWLGRRRRRAA